MKDVRRFSSRDALTLSTSSEREAVLRRRRSPAPRILGVLLPLLLGACGGSDGDSPYGTGGSHQGGGSGGQATSTGGQAAGGSPGGATGGTTTGGSATGGMTSTGGLGGAGPTGGAPLGGGGASGGAGATGGSSGTATVRLEARTDESTPAKPAFTWSGSAIVARFQGTGATVLLEGSPNQFQVLIDGKPTTVVKTTSGTSRYTVATGLSPGAYDLVVWRRTEGNLGVTRFAGVEIAGGALLPLAAPKTRRLEIYGDSISAGYGLDGKGPDCKRSSDTDNHYLTYGAVTARALSLELRTIAWSGIGMYRNYNSTAASPDAMPAVYARTLADDASKAWDFSRWQPDAVVINLGTNDFSTHGDPGMPYRMAYLDFVRGLRKKYPTAWVVLTIGPMLDGDNLTAVRGHLQAVIQTLGAEGDSKLSYLEYPVQMQADGYGCDWHPSAATNTKMATLLTAELKKRLGW